LNVNEMPMLDVHVDNIFANIQVHLDANAIIVHDHQLMLFQLISIKNLHILS
jgi:hypothetical protein